MLLVSTDDPQTDVKRRRVHETGSRKIVWLVWYSIGLSAFSKCWVDRHQGLIKSLSCLASFLAGVILSAKASLLGQAVDARIQGCIYVCSSVRWSGDASTRPNSSLPCGKRERTASCGSGTIGPTGPLHILVGPTLPLLGRRTRTAGSNWDPCFMLALDRPYACRDYGRKINQCWLDNTTSSTPPTLLGER